MAMTTTDMGGFRSGFDRLFNELENSMMGGSMMPMSGGMMNMGPMMAGKTSGMIMKMDLCEKDNAYHMWMDMPGCRKEDCNITVDESKNMMIVTCERRREMDRNDPNMMCCERPCGKMMRSIMFPDTADLNRADIRMENGMMCCNIPKRESPKGRQLRIK